jgi:hypothetical protein
MFLALKYFLSKPRIQPDDGLSAETCSCFSFFIRSELKVVLRRNNLFICTNVKSHNGDVNTKH